MLKLFGRSQEQWRRTTLESLSGEEHDLKIVIRNFPCLADRCNTKYKYAYPDFGYEFIEELFKGLGEVGNVGQVLRAGRKQQATLRLRDLPPFDVELSGRPPTDKHTFYAELPDAVIAAFQSVGMRRA